MTTVDNAAERARRQVGRPSTAGAHRDLLVQALTEEPSLRSVELLHRARQGGYSGGNSALYALAQALRTKVVTPLVRFEGRAGECSHGFGEVRVRYQDGAEEIVHFFASRLKHSRRAEVTLVPDEQVETLVRSLVDHVAAFGGIPLVAVCDRPKTVVLQRGRDGVATERNPTLAGVALELGLGVEVCWPYRPQEKRKRRKSGRGRARRYDLAASEASHDPTRPRPRSALQTAASRQCATTEARQTHLAIAIAYRVIQNGFDAYDDLSAAFRRGELADALPLYTHPAVLVVEVGYLTYGTDAANMLFHVANDRHRRRRSMIFMTNKSVKAWGRVLHDDDLAQAIIDRVLERGRLFRLDGPSIRTLHTNFDEALNEGSDQEAEVARISGNGWPEFPEPTTRQKPRR